jgi:hypothetical protein
MELGFLLLTDASEAHDGKVFVLGGGWNALRFPEVPAQWAFGIALGLDVAWDETNRRHEIEVAIEDPDGAGIADPFTVELEAGRPAGMPVGHEQRFVMSIGTSSTFSVWGPHAVVVRANGETLGRTRFYVMRIETPET